MSTSRTQIREFANYVGSHPALKEFEDRVDKRIYDAFKKAESVEDRVAIGNLHDGFTAVLNEIHIVIDEMRQEKQANEARD